MALTQVQPAMLASDSQYTGFKNRIINGAMVIDQRNAGASVTLPDGAAGGAYPVDRWFCSRASTATATAQQSSSAPAGFTNSFVITNGTGISVGSTGQGYAIQFIEGFNSADLGWGTASAQAVTLSFWVRSSITGTHSGAFWNNGFNRSYPFTYTISSANTWEQKSITIPGDTSGTWIGATNGRGICLSFNNGSGSTYLGTAGSWASAGYYGATGSVALNSVTSSTWYVTGVQLEKGSTATSFDYRPYGTELNLCQRYCQVIANQGYETLIGIGMCLANNRVLTDVSLKVQMRTQPSVTLVGTTSQIQNISSGGSWYGAQSVNYSPNPYIVRLDINYAAGYFTAGYAAETRIETSTSLVISAEL